MQYLSYTTVAHPRSIHLLMVTLVAVVLGGCRGRSELADAYGNFESDEVLVSSESAGVLMRFDVDEGDNLEAGTQVGIVDTVQLVLQREQLVAQRAAVRSRAPGIAAQIEVVEEQRRIARREKVRVESLLAQGAATAKQLDDLNGQLNLLDRQMASIRTQNAPLVAELDVINAQQSLIDYRIDKSRIVNPVAGTVLVTFAEAHELAAPGKPLYKVAKLDTLILRAYVSGAQLSRVRLGQNVAVAIDGDGDSGSSDGSSGEGDGLIRLSGTIVWISPQAEFTPKLIQTKEERVNLVYAIKVRVPNVDGKAKLGMPGEVWFENNQ